MDRLRFPRETKETLRTCQQPNALRGLIVRATGNFVYERVNRATCKDEKKVPRGGLLARKSASK